ncbi:MAG: hypothetical protein JNL10_08720 [Verrucomicrobiales bacterium]|nr:hypothetical protein [Verrucomicrobiales bacterium]
MVFNHHRWSRWVWAALLSVWPWVPSAGAAPAHFEARQTHPIGLTPGGRHLLAVHSPGARLSVFDIVGDADSRPLRVAEIPVGLEPVSVRARTDDEVWVVNEASDSVSIVSLSRRLVVATLPCADEPADLAFAGNRAFVSCARNRVLRVFDTERRLEIAAIPLEGVCPRALAVSSDGTRVYVAFQLSGNRTTVLPPSKASPPPAPVDPSLPAAPATAEIVDASDPRVLFTVLDHDVAEVSVETLGVVRYLSQAGTSLFDLALRPGVSRPELWVANTEARNRVRFESNLRGHVVDNRLTRLGLDPESVTAFDLNPGLDYGVLPNETAQSTALAQPTALVFSADGSQGWVAAFGSDRVARFDPASGSIEARMDVRAPVANESRTGPGTVRGPRGLVLHPSQGRLYVLNKLSDTLSIIDTGSDRVSFEIPVATADPFPAEVRAGRGVLFDARLSGNGTASCATCHLDADHDGLAWDLGNPSGAMIQVSGANLAVHDPTPRTRELHPMKGPMTTQTLRGLAPGQPLHWRGDRPTLAHFNATFPDLLGGAIRPGADIHALQAYLDTLKHPPNPNRNPDNTLPAQLDGGNPVRGQTLFNLHINHCSVCHVLPRGTDQNLDDPRNFGGAQPIKTPSLQTVYQRAVLSSRPGSVSISGFGLGHDGSGGNQSLPTIHFYELDQFTGADFADVGAFVRCFDTGTAPAVGRSLTVTASGAGDAGVAASLSLLETQAVRANGCDLVVQGRWGGVMRKFIFEPATLQYREDAAVPGARLFPRRDLLSGLDAQDALTFLGVPPGEGDRYGRDSNGNGIPDGDEPLPVLVAEGADSGVRLHWPSDHADWCLERASIPTGPWVPERGHRHTDSNRITVNPEPETGVPQFFRLRRTW